MRSGLELLLIMIMTLGLFAGSPLARANENIFQIHQITPLLQKSYDGKGQTVGVLDMKGTQNRSAQVRPELQGHFTDGSWLPLSQGMPQSMPEEFDHSTSVISLISSHKNNSASPTSVSPGALVDFAFSGEVFDTPVVQDEEIHFKYDRFEELPFTLEALGKLTQGRASAINISKTLPLRHAKRLHSLLFEYTRKGGVLLTSLGNQGVVWNRSKLADFKNEFRVGLNENTIPKDCDLWNSQDCAYFSASLFFNWIAQPSNEDLFNSTLFVAALDSSGKKLHPASNAPGSFAPQRTLLVIGEDISILGSSTQKGTGTSYATAIATGVFALLRQAFPNCRPQVVAQAMLDSATYDGLGFDHQSKWIHASHLKSEKKMQFFGRGRLDAQAAYVLAQDPLYCGTPTPAL